jgi:hypothetical protein
MSKKASRGFTITLNLGEDDYRVYPLAVDPVVAYEVTLTAPQGWGEELGAAASDRLGALPLEVVMRQLVQALVDALPELRGMNAAVQDVDRPAPEDWEPEWELKEAGAGQRPNVLANPGGITRRGFCFSFVPRGNRPAAGAGAFSPAYPKTSGGVPPPRMEPHGGLMPPLARMATKQVECVRRFVRRALASPAAGRPRPNPGQPERG